MWFWGNFFSTVLVIDTFYVKYCSVLTSNAVLENLPQNCDNFWTKIRESMLSNVKASELTYKNDAIRTIQNDNLDLCSRLVYQ